MEQDDKVWRIEKIGVSRQAITKWENGTFIFKQIPSTISKDIVPKMQSLPQAVKDEFDMRKKSSGEEDLDYESVFDIKKIAERVEKLRKEKLELEQTIINDIPKIKTIDDEINDKKGEVG